MKRLNEIVSSDPLEDLGVNYDMLYTYTPSSIYRCCYLFGGSC